MKQLDLSFTSGIQTIDRLGDFNPGETYRIEIEETSYYAKIIEKNLFGVIMLLVNFEEEMAELREIEYDILHYYANAGLVQGIIFHDWC